MLQGNEGYRSGGYRPFRARSDHSWPDPIRGLKSLSPLAHPGGNRRRGMIAGLCAAIVVAGVVVQTVRRKSGATTSAPSAAVAGVPEVSALEKRAELLAQKYKDELLTRLGTHGWIRVEVDVLGKDPWAQSQALAALFWTPSSLSLFDSVLKEPLQVLLQSRTANGWNNGDFHKYFHVEPVIWTGVALARLTAASS